MPAPSKIIFFQFNYRIENQIFIKAMSGLLKNRNAEGVFITDDDAMYINQTMEAMTLRRVFGRNEKKVFRNERPLTSGAPPLESGSFTVNGIKEKLYILKKDLKQLVDFLSKLKESYQAVEEIPSIDAVVGIEPHGGVAAFLVSKKLKKKFFYYSGELFRPFFKTPWIDAIFKFYFTAMLQQAEAVVVQDSSRSDILKKEYKLKGDKIILLPVGTIDPVNRNKSRYFYEKFNIPDHKKIILYAGSIKSWAFLKEIAEAAHDWPPDYSLVIHGFAGKGNSYLEILKPFIDEKKVFLSTETVDWSELDKLLCSAYLSIAAYSGDDENTQFISFSSNKLANYARCGLPLLIKHTDHASEMFKQIKWGETFMNFADIVSAIQVIDQKYNEYREKCFEAFSNFYDLNHLGKVFLDVLTKSGPVR